MSHSKHTEIAKSVTARCAVLTCSDTRTTDTDTSGQLIQEQLTDAGHELVSYSLIPDEAEEIRSHLTRLASEEVEVVVINGGTGISKRDNTFDAVQNMIETPIPGFGELFRMLSYQDIGPAAMLSRATAGLIGNMAVFSLPGSRGAVELAMQELILPQIGHLVSELRK